MLENIHKIVRDLNIILLRKIKSTVPHPLWIHRHQVWFTGYPPARGATALTGPRLPHCRGIDTTHTHTDTPQSVGILWTRDWSISGTSTWQHTKFTPDRQPCPAAGFEPVNPASKRQQTYALDSAAMDLLSSMSLGSILCGTCMTAI